MAQKLIQLDAQTIVLKNGSAPQTFKGQILIYNISNFLVAVKIKSNNPSSYIVSPSSLILQPHQQLSIMFTRNYQENANILADKFKFYALAILNGAKSIHSKVSSQLFEQAESKDIQKVLVNVKLHNNRQLQSMSNPQIQVSLPIISSRHSPPLSSPRRITTLNSFSTKATGVGNNRISLNPLHPRSQSDMSKVLSNYNEESFKEGYERLNQKIYEYEILFQELSQEIKDNQQVKEEWKQIDNTNRMKCQKSKDNYQMWQIWLVVLMSMLFGALCAK